MTDSRVWTEVDALTGEVVIRPYTDDENRQADEDANDPFARNDDGSIQTVSPPPEA